MRRFIFLFIIISGVVSFIVACNGRDNLPKATTEIYYVDERLNCLLPCECEIIDATPQDMANAVIDKLVEGRDDDYGIRRVIPSMDKALSVTVKDTVAYVDIDSKIKEKMKHYEEDEKLFIYQIVNSLTSLKGIRFVRFTVDGAIHKDFLGFYDMRDTFKYKYPE